MIPDVVAYIIKHIFRVLSDFSKEGISYGHENLCANLSSQNKIKKSANRNQFKFVPSSNRNNFSSYLSYFMKKKYHIINYAYFIRNMMKVNSADIVI